MGTYEELDGCRPRLLLRQPAPSKGEGRLLGVFPLQRYCQGEVLPDTVLHELQMLQERLESPGQDGELEKAAQQTTQGSTLKVQQHRPGSQSVMQMLGMPWHIILSELAIYLVLVCHIAVPKCTAAPDGTSHSNLAQTALDCSAVP